MEVLVITKNFINFLFRENYSEAIGYVFALIKVHYSDISALFIVRFSIFQIKTVY